LFCCFVKKNVTLEGILGWNVIYHPASLGSSIVKEYLGSKQEYSYPPSFLDHPFISPVLLSYFHLHLYFRPH